MARYSKTGITRAQADWRRSQRTPVSIYHLVYVATQGCADRTITSITRRLWTPPQELDVTDEHTNKAAKQLRREAVGSSGQCACSVRRPSSNWPLLGPLGRPFYRAGQGRRGMVAQHWRTHILYTKRDGPDLLSRRPSDWLALVDDAGSLLPLGRGSNREMAPERRLLEI